MFVLRVPKSKTDQAGEGREITLEPSGDQLSCPVKVVSEFLQSDSWSPKDFYFEVHLIGEERCLCQLFQIWSNK